MAKKLRVGFIGCGGMSHAHGRWMAATKKVDVVAGAEPIPEHFDKMKHYMVENAPRFDTHQEMLKEVELDAAVIITPHNVHYEHILACMKKGIHILCEKPMVCTVKHARDICAKANKYKKVFSVSYQRHYQAQYAFIQRAIAKGLIGEVQYVSALQAQNWKELVAGTWRQEQKTSCGGQLNDSGSHLIDIILWMTGLAAKKVSTDVENFDNEVDINSSVAVQFDNGSIGNLSVIGHSKCEFHEDISIWGSEGTILMRFGQPLRFYDKTGAENIIGTKEMPKEITPDAAFVQSILKGTPTLTPAECGLRVIQLTENIWKAGKSGRSVKIL